MPEYEAALTGAAYFFPPQAGYLSLAGADRIGFLQRQTTDDLRQLSDGRARLTILTSPTARILDALLVFPQGEALSVIPLAGRSAATFSFLKSRIFFNDKVSLSDLSAEFTQVEVMGAGAGSALARVGIAILPEADHVQTAGLAEAAGFLIGKSNLIGGGWRWLLRSSEAEDLEKALTGTGLVKVRTEVVEILRVERGVPGAGRELSEAYTPLEAGLGAAVSSQKGCYTGQEVLARQLTYDKVTRKLVGLSLGQPVEAGEAVLAEGKPAGQISSPASSPRFGAIALAVLKRPYHEPGTAVAVQHGDQIVQGRVTALPFTER